MQKQDRSGRPDGNTIRADDETLAQLKRLREAMQAQQPYGRIALSEALKFAVSSASAAMAAQQEAGRRRDEAA